MDAKRFMCPFGQAARGQCCLLDGSAAEIHSLNRYPSFRFLSAVVNAVVISHEFQNDFRRSVRLVQHFWSATAPGCRQDIDAWNAGNQ
jgi:hypothetical protein